jgi:hypothetical protein
MRYDLYVGKTLYLSTLNMEYAFSLLRRWMRSKLEVKLKLVPLI